MGTSSKCSVFINQNNYKLITQILLSALYLSHRNQVVHTADGQNSFHKSTFFNSEVIFRDWEIIPVRKFKALLLTFIYNPIFTSVAKISISH